MTAPPVALGADDLAALRALLEKAHAPMQSKHDPAPYNAEMALRQALFEAAPALLDAIEALQAQVEAGAAERERAEGFEELFNLCAEARDETGFFGTVPDCIKYLSDEATVQTARADAAQSALSDERAASAAMKTALIQMEEACERLAATRPRKAYLAMIDAGQSNSLIALDEARSAARLALHTAAGERRDER